MNHIIASRNYRQENHFRQVFQRGKGKIGIIQPGQADTDWVTDVWLKDWRSELKPGTVIIQNGVTFRIEEQP